MIAKIILSLTHSDIDRIFDYVVPSRMLDHLAVGMRVFVPFGRRNSKTEGYVIGLSEESEVPPEKLKEVFSVLDEKPVLSKELVALGKWMKEKYYTTLSRCLQTVIPAGMKTKTDSEMRQTVKYLELAVAKEALAEEMQALSKDKRKAGQLAVLGYLQKAGKPVLAREVLETLGISNSPMDTLLKRGVIKMDTLEKRRDTLLYEQYEMQQALSLNKEQEAAFAGIEALRRLPEIPPVLLHGVTGSGKTELYLQVIAKVLSEGKQAIVLVPEISLTPQTVRRFVSRFGRQVTVTHSRLTARERYDQWKRARDHEVSVMIGPRSAVFAPFDRLGIIIMDEEHENSYQSETSPKYDAREVARWRCRYQNALLLMGSATPSLETYYRAREGAFRLFTLKERAQRSMLPQVAIADMRAELENGNRSIFSAALYHAIQENLERKKQTILFLNRRGYATFVSCRKCGHVMVCDNCNVSYTYHQSTGKLLCHYCGKKIPHPEVCPACGSKYIRYFGTGTQKVEAEVKKYFPNAGVLRMDSDTTGKKHSMEDMLGLFLKGGADILIGTQMIAKGHDFPNVTLVGILAADLSLNCGDYRGAETTFSLLTQVAGRAGRADAPGFVVIQTYNPDNYAVKLAAKQDYEAFYEEEIKLRRVMGYPPFSHLCSILATGKKEEEVILGITRFFQYLEGYNRKKAFVLLGPSPASISKIRREYRWRILVKGKEEERLRAYVLYVYNKYQEKERLGGVLLNITIDPPVIV